MIMIKYFRDRIRFLQKRCRKNTLYLTEEAGFCRATYNHWKRRESVNIIEKINRLCLALECSPNELLSYGDYDWGNQDLTIVSSEQLKENQQAWANGTKVEGKLIKFGENNHD